MAQNVYECMLIFNSNTYARDPSGVSGKLPKMVEGCGGEMLASRLWNEQRLAYPIKGLACVLSQSTVRLHLQKKNAYSTL